MESCDYRANPSAAAEAPTVHPDRDNPNAGGTVVGPFPDLGIHNEDLEPNGHDGWDKLSDFSSTYQMDRGDEL